MMNDTARFYDRTKAGQTCPRLLEQLARGRGHAGRLGGIQPARVLSGTPASATPMPPGNAENPAENGTWSPRRPRARARQPEVEGGLGVTAVPARRSGASVRRRTTCPSDAGPHATEIFTEIFAPSCGALRSGSEAGLNTFLTYRPLTAAATRPYDGISS
jgi:hypothetical protein